MDTHATIVLSYYLVKYLSNCKVITTQNNSQARLPQLACRQTRLLFTSWFQQEKKLAYDPDQVISLVQAI